MSKQDNAPPSPSGGGPASQLLSLWEQGQRPSVWEFLAAVKSLSREQFLEVLLVDQQQRWQSGERVLVETYLEQHPTLRSDAEAVLDLAYREYLLRRSLSENPSEEEYVRRFPDYAAHLRKLFDVDRVLGSPLPSEPLSVAEKQTRPDGPPAAEPPPEAWPQVDGYQILDVLGKGGMGVVYKAWHLNLKRHVALKMMNGLSGNDQRFRREAELLARLRHPNFVQIHDISEQEGRPYLSLEYVEGGSLEKKLAGRPQPPAEAAELIEELARAMHAAHRQSIIHRDLKPANVLLTTAGLPKITDFGLAKCLEDVGLTQSGVQPGTPLYMAPEQAAGDSGRIGPATDVYALGVVLYEMLTGRPPFCGSDLEKILNRVRTEDPVPPRKLQKSVPRDLERICLKCLEKHPAKRYRTAEELADELRRFQERKPLLHTRRTPAWEKMGKWAKRRPAAAAVLALGLLLGLLSGGGGLWYWDAYKREKVAYYGRFVCRRGNMEGVGPALSAEQVRHRLFTYKVHSRGGLVEKVEVVNGQGQLTTLHTATPFIDNPFAPLTDKQECIYTFKRNDQGQVIMETAYPRDRPDGQFAYELHYDVKNNLGHYVGADGHPKRWPDTEASYVKFSWTEAGLLKSIRYQDTDGNPQKGKDGSYGMAFRYNGQNMLQEITILDDKGEPMLGGLGFAKIRTDYLDGGQGEEKTFLGVDGQAVTRKDGCAKLRLHFDPYGNPDRAVFLDIEDKPCRCAEGYAQIKFDHDDQRNLVKTYLDPEGNPDSTRDGRSLEVFDDAGNVVERTWISKGRDGYAQLGIARRITKYDERGRHVQEDYFDRSDQPAVVGPSGFTRIRMTYAEARDEMRVDRSGPRDELVETAYHNLREDAVLNKDGYHGVRYYENGIRLPEPKYFDREGKHLKIGK
jgi:serine/threonine-protein kinase